MRVVIENIDPEIDQGRYSIKRTVGELVSVKADIYADGHDLITAVLLYRHSLHQDWQEVPMQLTANDRWRAEFKVKKTGVYLYTIKAWVDHFRTWQQDLKEKYKAGHPVQVELKIGAELIEKTACRAQGPDHEVLKQWAGALKRGDDPETQVEAALSSELSGLMQRHPPKKWVSVYDKELSVEVERPQALFSAWYEFFPRSFGQKPGQHGTFKTSQKLLPYIAEMGFDVVYLPPIHPIGQTHRKGKNNQPQPQPNDPGSPWAIGSQQGGHKSIHPQLGTLSDFQEFVQKAAQHDLEVALDLAFQCSPDHPYVKEHPEWFLWRPDGSIQHAENPPKKYEDIIPLNIGTDDGQALWEELKSVVLFWVEKGIRLFRVDNPHTKPFAFWEWLIREVKKEHPDVLFLSEAFTRPKVMYRLAKAGFSQSYTYFTWRNSKHELQEYLRELTQTQIRQYFRPHFWPNTPDILPQFLQHGGRPAFLSRLVLAATLSSNYGIYGPAFELLVSEAVPKKEEYLNSEKYEIKNWDLSAPENIKGVITRVNQIRRKNPALQTTWNVSFLEADNDQLLCFSKTTPDLSNIVLVVVNLDPFHTQSGWVKVPVEDLKIDPHHPYLVHDLLSGDKYFWQGSRNYVELNPGVMPAHIFKLHRKVRREQDFDYFM
ncbi:MAG TPA: alpha-1,4-glucan--maltose-1-phosphate maltosyltransferase [Acidobacteriota bacterium]|nr:alpha-1,4-glucan--maltose-1-phosphate maltosyltransferase [Acidobacteriota bacterium]